MAREPTVFKRNLHKIQRALILALASGALAAYASAAGCVIGDEFLCGVPLETDLARAKVCDRPGEMCICDTNRCAVNHPACDGGLRYSFGDKDCVEIDKIESAIVQSAGNEKFCNGAGRPKRCGESAGVTCSNGQVCACMQKRCAIFDSIGCPSGYRYADSDECVEPIDARPEALLFYDDENPGLCPSEMTPPSPCGREMSETCGETEVCICASNLFRCAKKSPGCPSGYAYFDGSCVREMTSTDIEAPENQVNTDGVCPQYAAKDAGKD
jgi:hypothetical protein